MENVTVIKGRDASFTCVVLNIGPHRVCRLCYLISISFQICNIIGDTKDFAQSDMKIEKK